MTSLAFTRVRGRPQVIRLSSVFSPLALVVFLYVPLLLLYVVSSPSVFATDFGSRKAFTWTAFAYFSLALLSFAAGAKLGSDRVRSRARSRGESLERALTPTRERSMAVLVEAALIISVAASLLWFALGVIRAGGIAPFVEIWQREPFRLKGEILATVPGVTTLMQLAVAAIPLAVVYGLNRKGSVIRILIVLALVLAAARAVFFSERLALVELLLPLVFLALAHRRVTVSRVTVYAVALLAVVMTFFAVTELRRTYAYTGDFSASRAATRFVGYYLTSVNNGMVVVDEYPAETPLYSTGEILWHFPVVGDLRLEHLPGVGTISFRYDDAFGIDPQSFWPQVFRAEGLDYEFNVFSTPGFLAADFGWAGLVAIFVLGLASGAIFRRSQTSRLHLALYAVWVVGLFELMRIFYFADTRLLPAYLVFLAAYLVVRRPTPLDVRRAVTQGPGRPVGTIG
jgi:oligosaccharide repeat unit polymerase